MADSCFLGLDFGTESVRAILVDAGGRELGVAVHDFAHGQIVTGSPWTARLKSPLPTAFALQHPDDWLTSAAQAVRAATKDVAIDAIAGIGVDFTSCTMLPCSSEGDPLATRHEFATNPHAWPKLWKHHGAAAQTDTINRVARERGESWLARYGGVIGLEWFFPKMLEVIEEAPEIADAAEVWLEAGDWFVWQLIGAPSAGGVVFADQLPRSTCQAGYKACWSKDDGYPSADFLAACHPMLADAVAEKMPGRLIAPGEAAGRLCPYIAEKFGLRPGVPVSSAIIDAHAGVPGAGVAETGTLVMVLGTSGCHMLLAEEEHLVPGVAGIVADGILPGFFGYETGQAAMGDAFDWARRLAGHDDFSQLDALARDIEPGADGIVALDWFNGCRTPLMDGGLTGALIGLRLDHSPAHIYRAMLESSAMGLRWIVETLRDGGVPVERFVATGGLPHHNPLFIEIVASALGAPVHVHGSAHGPALGAAILGAIASGAFDSAASAVEAMAGRSSAQPSVHVVEPNVDFTGRYDQLFDSYRRLADDMNAAYSPMRSLSQ